MKINLAAQAKAAGKTRRKRIELPPYSSLHSAERELAKIYTKVLNVWVTGVKQKLLPEYRRSLNEAKLIGDSALSLEAIIDQIEKSALAAILTFRSEFTEWMAAFQNRHISFVVSKIKYATGVDLATQLSRADVAATLEDILIRNVNLVRSVSDQARSRIGETVFRGFQNKTSIREVAKEINHSIGLGWDRSLRIASDQTVKLAATLDQERQEQLGIDSFKWVHSGKKHYRVEHKERDGMIFKWSSDVGQNDPPGQAPFCGCKALGVLEFD